MTKMYTKKECYDFYLSNLASQEIPLNLKEWEREIYPKDLKFMKFLGLTPEQE